MGCNCGKGTRGTASTSTASASASTASASTAPTAAADATSMTGRTQSFALIEDGREQRFGSMLEARAAQVRAGGRGRVVRTGA